MRITMAITMLFSAVFAKAQYSLDHYHPKAIIVEEGIVQLNIYSGYISDSTLFETWKYDENGNEIAHIEHKSETKTEYTYNDGNQLVKSVWKPDKYDLSETDTFIYSNGLLVQKLSMDESGTERGRVDYIYANRILVEEEHYLKSAFSYRIKYFYSKEGWLDSSRIYDKDRLIRTEDWTRDGQGRMVAFKGCTIGRAHVVLQEYVYNDEGLELEHSILDYITGLKSQHYVSEYTDKKLLRFVERYTDIVNGDLKRAKYEKRVYVYK